MSIYTHTHTRFYYIKCSINKIISVLYVYMRLYLRNFCSFGTCEQCINIVQAIPNLKMKVITFVYIVNVSDFSVFFFGFSLTGPIEISYLNFSIEFLFVNKFSLLLLIYFIYTYYIHTNTHNLVHSRFTCMLTVCMCG